MKVVHTDCLVIGAGLAGSAYALHAARHGLNVELLSLAAPLVANSDWAQGGIIYDTSTDSAALARDIFEASDQTANPAAVDQLVREGHGAVKELLLDELQVGFDRTDTGALDFTACASTGDAAAGTGRVAGVELRRITPADGGSDAALRIPGVALARIGFGEDDDATGVGE